MRIITVDDIMDWLPCRPTYRVGNRPTARLIQIVGDGIPLSAEGVRLARKRCVPEKDIIWAGRCLCGRELRDRWFGARNGRCPMVPCSDEERTRQVDELSEVLGDGEITG